MNKYQFYGWEKATIKDNNGLTPIDYYDLLTNIWCKDTCAPRMRKDWSKDNKTLGQCSITAFLMQDIYGGKVYGILNDDQSYHCFNKIGDIVFDLTSEQFNGKLLDYNDCCEQFREIHFAKEEKKNRYEYLKKELIKAVNQFIKEKYRVNPVNIYKRRKNNYNLTGEDIDLLKDNRHKKEKVSICDIHEDGA